MSAVTEKQYKTGDTVEESGKYVCVSGEIKELQAGDVFPDCPITKQATNWRHMDHEHKTGEEVTASGKYVSNEGQEAELSVGKTFPVCPISGKDTSWKHV
ncbi:hypothetical protein [Paenibacillus sp. HB172176]|uniref:hypothetical protein n=1 Tax=Paenibacillus sp. HB172176 TaxID=2493690 RepID=UPI0014397644|nr:hypothetical protein [Paenibacillus sp. HB172176]